MKCILIKMKNFPFSNASSAISFRINNIDHVLAPVVLHPRKMVVKTSAPSIKNVTVTFLDLAGLNCFLFKLAVCFTYQLEKKN